MKVRSSFYRIFGFCKTYERDIKVFVMENILTWENNKRRTEV